MKGKKRVCLVTTGHPSTNPRLVKEADALTEAGYDVHVVACKFLRWADEADEQFRDRPWPVSWVPFGAMPTPLQRQYQRIRKKLASGFTHRVGFPRLLNVRALHYVVPELARAATRVHADLYIAHNLGALPAAYAAARKHRARLGFDAEDFHRGEFPDGEDSLARQLTMRIEERYIPACDYVTAASDGIAEAYARDLRIARPTTILNVFPLAEREVALSAEERAREKPDGLVSLYWFSQTIGPGRGLEDVVRALPHLPSSVVLSLRGKWTPGYEDKLMDLARAIGVASRIRALPVSPPREMIGRANCHDIGLALEQGETENRRICVTNKLFTYTLAGIPAIATDTPGQRAIAARLGGMVKLYLPHRIEELIQAVISFMSVPASDYVRSAVVRRFNWDFERGVFLSVVSASFT